MEISQRLEEIKNDLAEYVDDVSGAAERHISYLERMRGKELAYAEINDVFNTTDDIISILSFLLANYNALATRTAKCLKIIKKTGKHMFAYDILEGMRTAYLNVLRDTAKTVNYTVKYTSDEMTCVLK